MILIRSLLILFLCLSSANAFHIKWQGNYDRALELAKQTNKDLMVFLRKKDCKECQKMLETTLLNKSYIEGINSNFVSVIATYEGKNNYPIEHYYSNIFPVVFFVSSKDELFLIEPISGYVDEKTFREKISDLNIK